MKLKKFLGSENLNSDTAELTIQSVINNSPAASADIQPNDVIIKIDGKSTKGMGIKEASHKRTNKISQLN